MTKVNKIKRGLDIPIKGAAESNTISDYSAEFYAVKPTDFRQFNPRLLVKEGDQILAGTALMQNKNDERIVLASPRSGTIHAIVRGEKRLLLEVIIKADSNQQYLDFGSADPKTLSREAIIAKMLQSGVWPMIKQRPYAIIAKPEDSPKAIFVSAFDSAPLAPDADFIMQGTELAFQTGIDALGKLTEGKVHLNVHATLNTTDFYLKIRNVQINHFAGPHPSGNIGVQIHQIDPINKGEVIWYCSPQDVVAIGRLFLKGQLDMSRITSLSGSEVKEPQYFRLIAGAQVKELIYNRLKSENVRIISGNVLTGTKISKEGYIGFYDQLISVIPEGDYYEFFGWASPGFGKHSASRTFWSWLTPGKKYTLNTNYHGGERAFVMTGQYEKVFPFDIYPVQLLKAILAKDIELMEKLGIYEIAEEDFALCEYVCTSKIESQQIVRDGIDLMIKEMN